uniref:Uncharacterized protein n=1 Tax=Oryza brachyantha TaxID=4533 RepID=J3N787_ORYBR
MEPERSSPREVRAEMARCFDLVGRLGRGAVYLGSSRVPATHPCYLQATELAREAGVVPARSRAAAAYDCRGSCCRPRLRVRRRLHRLHRQAAGFARRCCLLPLAGIRRGG